MGFGGLWRRWTGETRREKFYPTVGIGSTVREKFCSSGFAPNDYGRDGSQDRHNTGTRIRDKHSEFRDFFLTGKSFGRGQAGGAKKMFPTSLGNSPRQLEFDCENGRRMVCGLGLMRIIATSARQGRTLGLRRKKNRSKGRGGTLPLILGILEEVPSDCHGPVEKANPRIENGDEKLSIVRHRRGLCGGV